MLKHQKFNFLINQGFKDHRILINIRNLKRIFLKEAEYGSKSNLLKPDYTIAHNNQKKFESKNKLKEGKYLFCKSRLQLNPDFTKAYRIIYQFTSKKIKKK